MSTKKPNWKKSQKKPKNGLGRKSQTEETGDETRENNKTWFDFTSFDVSMTGEFMLEALWKIAKKYKFQMEPAEETKRVHWQGRMIVRKACRKMVAIKRLRDVGIRPDFVTATSQECKNSVIRWDYVQKEERIGQAYDDRMWKGPVPILLRGLKPFPLQDKLMALGRRAHSDDAFLVRMARIVHVIVNPTRRGGKSRAIRFLRYHKLCQRLPDFDDTNDMIAAVCDLEEDQMYVVDIPFGASQSHIDKVAKICESIKDGYVYDKRNKFDYKEFEKPPIVVMCVNTNLGQKMREATDRYVVLLVDENNDLIPWTQDDEDRVTTTINLARSKAKPVKRDIWGDEVVENMGAVPPPNPSLSGRAAAETEKGNELDQIMEAMITSKSGEKRKAPGSQCTLEPQKSRRLLQE